MPRKRKSLEPPVSEWRQEASPAYDDGIDAPFHMPPETSDDPVSTKSLSAKKDKADPKVRTVGGMIEKRWAGVPMWACPRCNGTTFDAGEAKIHTCKLPKFADELDQE